MQSDQKDYAVSEVLNILAQRPSLASPEVLDKLKGFVEAPTDLKMKQLLQEIQKDL